MQGELLAQGGGTDVAAARLAPSRAWSCSYRCTSRPSRGPLRAGAPRCRNARASRRTRIGRR
eukprot:2256062-Pyramimonas_sp.AAC.1